MHNTLLQGVVLSQEAEQLIHDAFKDLPTSQIMDYHVHLIGTVTASTGNFIHSYFLSRKHLFHYLASRTFQKAFGITDLRKADEEALNMLLKRATPQAKYCILAMDKYFDENGFFDLVKSKIFVSNDYIFNASAQFPDQLVPCVSIHPYRENSLDSLEKWAAQGVKMVKWLPNSMGMHLADPRSLRFYRKMAEKHLILLVHCGSEATGPLVREQKLGNPLLLRHALDSGVKVIAAHCGTLGKGEDLDSSKRKRVSNFQLFLRLMEKEEYKNRLFGDLASVTQINRMKYLPSLLELSQPGNVLSGRLVNGSDYPLPAISILTSTVALKKGGYITSKERVALKEIYKQNPLLFDFVLKRTLRHPRTKKQFPSELFLINKQLNILK